MDVIGSLTMLAKMNINPTIGELLDMGFLNKHFASISDVFRANDFKNGIEELKVKHGVKDEDTLKEALAKIND